MVLEGHGHWPRSQWEEGDVLRTRRAFFNIRPVMDRREWAETVPRLHWQEPGRSVKWPRGSWRQSEGAAGELKEHHGLWVCVDIPT